METSTSVEATPAMEAAEARLPARGEAPRDSSMIESAERAGVRASLPAWPGKSMLTAGESSRSSAMKTVSAMKSASSIERIVIDENSAVGDVGVVVVNNSVAVPIVSPVVPAPAKAAEEADSKTEAKPNPRTGKVEPWIRIPTRPDPDGLSIHEPRVIFRNVNNLRVGGLDHNCLPLLAHLFLRCAF